MSGEDSEEEIDFQGFETPYQQREQDERSQPTPWSERLSVNAVSDLLGQQRRDTRQRLFAADDQVNNNNNNSTPSSSEEEGEQEQHLDIAQAPTQDVLDRLRPRGNMSTNNSTAASPSGGGGTSGAQGGSGKSSTQFVITDPDAMFAEVPQVQESDLGEGIVKIARTNRGDTSKEQKKSMESATKGLEDKFEMQHYQQTFIHTAVNLASPTSIDSNINPSKIEEVIVGTATKAKALVELLASYDFGLVYLVPRMKDRSALKPSDKWDFNDRSNIVLDSSSRTLEECKEWTAFCMLNGMEKCPFDSSLSAQDQRWGLMLVQNSSSEGLRCDVMSQMDDLPAKHKGGTVYLKIMFSLLEAVDTEVIEEMKKVIQRFKEVGPTDSKGQNIRNCRLLLMGVFRALSTNGAMPSEKDSLEAVTTGLSKCDANDEFKAVWSSIVTNRKNPFSQELGALDLGTSMPLLTRLDKVLLKAVAMYDSACMANKWTASSAGVYVLGNCFNCDQNHEGGWRKCPKPTNQANIDKNIALHKLKKATERGPSSGGGGRSKSVAASGAKPSGFQPYNNRSKWGPPGKGETAKNINGKAYCACRTCGGWISGDDAHSTGSHEAWAKDRANFALNNNHPYKILLAGRQSGTGNGGGGSGGKQNKKADSASVDDAVQKALTAQREGFQSKLEEFSKSTADPNASQFAAMMAQIFSVKD
eukprot:scaffold21245_cov98-Skeletonema_dohrnii-CCMP3373.AAC.3